MMEPDTTETTTSQSEPAQRPEHIPESFWDPEAGAPKVDDLAKAYTELEGQTNKTREELAGELEQERFANRPETPDKYEIKLPQDFEVPAGVELDTENLADQPLVAWWREKAHKLGLSQSEFEEGLATAAKSQATELEAIDAEIAKLGDNAEQRVEHVVGWAKANLPEAVVERFKSVLTTAEAVEAFEKLAEKMKPDGGVQPDSATGQPQKTEADLHKMMNDPRYWQTKDPDFIREVEDGFKKVYGTKPYQGSRALPA